VCKKLRMGSREENSPRTPSITARFAPIGTFVRLRRRWWRLRQRNPRVAFSRRLTERGKQQPRGHRGTLESPCEARVSNCCLKKLWGRSSRPLCRCLLQLLSASCCFSSLLSFWLPWIYSPFPFFMEFRNGILLQLFECIESTQNEVKRKMIDADTCNAVPKSPRVWCAKKVLRDGQLSLASVRGSSFAIALSRNAEPRAPNHRRASSNAARTVVKLAAIYNEKAISELKLLQGAETKERDHGRFE